MGNAAEDYEIKHHSEHERHRRPHGPQGPQGIQGPEGGSGIFGKEVFGSFFTRATTGDPQATVPYLGGVPFNLETIPAQGNGILHNDGSEDFILVHPGFYEVHYGVASVDSTIELALTLDGTIVSGSEMSFSSTNELFTRGTILQNLEGMSILRLINNNPAGDLHLRSGSDPVSRTSGSLVIIQLQ